MRVTTKMSRQDRLGVLAALALGASRSGAAKSIGKSIGWFRRQLADDAKFAKEVEVAEGQAETYLLGRLRETARDSQGWRAAAWLLERRNPDTFGRRRIGGIGSAEVERAIGDVIKAVSAEVGDSEMLERILNRIKELIE